MRAHSVLSGTEPRFYTDPAGVIMDIIFIDELRVTTLIGIYPREQSVPQTLEISLQIGTSTANAGSSDAASGTSNSSANDRVRAASGNRAIPARTAAFASDTNLKKLRARCKACLVPPSAINPIALKAATDAAEFAQGFNDGVIGDTHFGGHCNRRQRVLYIMHAR